MEVVEDSYCCYWNWEAYILWNLPLCVEISNSMMSTAFQELSVFIFLSELPPLNKHVISFHFDFP